MAARGGAATAFLLCSTLLGGCLGPDDAPQMSPRPVEETRSALDLAFDPDAAENASLRVKPDWYLLTVRGGPDAGLAGYRWELPPGAVVQDPNITSWHFLSLEVSPLLAAGADAPIEWALLAFREVEGEAVLEGGRIETPGTSRFEPLTQPLAPVEAAFGASARPGFLQFLFFDENLPERLDFVLMARTNVTQEFGLGFRFLDHRPSFQERPETSAEAFLRNRTSPRPAAVTPAGTGQGFQYAAYNSALSRSEVVTPSINVNDVTPRIPIRGASARDVTISAEFASERGWTTVGASLFGGEQVGTWTADVFAREQALRFQGVSLQTWDALLAGGYTTLLVGYPTVHVVAEGEGPSSATANFRFAGGAVLISHFLAFEQVDLGATLPALIGVPAQPAADTYGGLLELAPQPARLGTTGSVADAWRALHASVEG